MSFLRWAVLVWIGFFAHPISANIGQDFGLGSRAGALAGANGAWGWDGYSAYINPAAVAWENGRRLEASWSLVFMQPWFHDISGVVTQNDIISDTTRTGAVDTDYRSTLGQAFGMVIHPFPQWWNLSFGVSTFLPLSQLAYMDTGETFQPEYFLYRARTQRPQIEVAMGVRPWSQWTFGVGGHVGFSVTSNATLFLQTSSPKISTMRFSSSLKPKISPFAGVLFSSAEQGQETVGHLSSGLVFRFPMSHPNTLDLMSSARAFGDFTALDFKFLAESALFYDPMSLEWSVSWMYTASTRLYAQLDLQFWGSYASPSLEIKQPEITSCSASPGNCPAGGLEIRPGDNPEYPLRNIWVPKVGHEWTLGETTVRTGYSYRPSILREPMTGAGNFLDPDKHSVAVGLGWIFRGFNSLLSQPIRLDLHLAAQYLVPTRVTKTQGNEAGNLSGSKIGSPGYTAGGWVLGGGLSASLSL